MCGGHIQMGHILYMELAHLKILTSTVKDLEPTSYITQRWLTTSEVVKPCDQPFDIPFSHFCI